MQIESLAGITLLCPLYLLWLIYVLRGAFIHRGRMPAFKPLMAPCLHSEVMQSILWPYSQFCPGCIGLKHQLCLLKQKVKELF